jgi:hypothetical protein
LSDDEKLIVSEGEPLRHVREPGLSGNEGNRERDEITE